MMNKLNEIKDYFLGFLSPEDRTVTLEVLSFMSISLVASILVIYTLAH